MGAKYLAIIGAYYIALTWSLRLATKISDRGTVMKKVKFEQNLDGKIDFASWQPLMSKAEGRISRAGRSVNFVLPDKSR